MAIQQPNAAGNYVAQTVTTPVNMTTAVAINIAQITVPPGDWDIRGVIAFSNSTSTTNLLAALSLVSNAAPAGLSDTLSGSNGQWSALNLSSGVTNAETLVTGTGRLSVAVATIVYLVGLCTFSGTKTATGFIAARQAR